MNALDLRCPKCGRTLDLLYGRHANKWWVDHPGAALYAGNGSCLDSGKKWTHCDTEELAIAAFHANDSHCYPVSPETVALIDRLIEAEIGKNERDKRKGYARG